MSEKRLLRLILLAFVALGAIYALTTPVFEASDELWHYPMIRHLADGNPLPVQVFDPAQAGPWKQEASQPPLYYYLGAALTFWIDASDMEEGRRLNPHVDNGVVTPDRNINLIVHDPALSPWRGTLLAVRLVRLASVLMGAVTVTFTYLIAREVAPQRPEIALGAAAINAFTPMFLFISGAVNNDNLAIMLASIALYLMLRIVRRRGRTPLTGQNRPNLPEWLVVGVVIGLAALTKEGTLGLIPILLGTAGVASWQAVDGERMMRAQRGVVDGVTFLLRLLVRSLALTIFALLPALLIASWWYYRNVVLYGDWLGWNAFIAVLGERPQAATLAQLWDERWGFLASYWGLFGGVNVPMPDWIYGVMNALLLITIPGLAIFAGTLFRRWRRSRREQGVSDKRSVFGWIQQLFGFVSSHFALVVCIVFSLAVIVGLINWATTTWSSQGRLAFTAISTLSTLLALGLFGWMPPRPAAVAAFVAGAFFFTVAALAPFLWIAPAYEPYPAYPPVPLQPRNVLFEDKIALTGFAITDGGEAIRSGGALHPGDTLDVYLAWRVLEPMDRDWSVFVHLNDPVLNAPLTQRDMYPGGGLIATSFLKPGDELLDRLRLQIPSTAPAPAELSLIVGFYDFYSRENERLQANGRDAVELATVTLEPAQEDAATAETNFGNQLALTAFAVSPRRLVPGETMLLTSEWRGIGTPDEDYTLFAQLLGESGTTRWAADDIPTGSSQWGSGDVHEVQMELRVDDQTPPGVYTLIIGAYTRDADGNFNRLQIVRDGRITMEDVLQLMRIRIE